MPSKELECTSNIIIPSCRKVVFPEIVEFGKEKVFIVEEHTLYYRVGAGMFFNYTDLFFAEFNYFRKNNLPAGWDDDIGGAFQLLRRHQYNEVDKYVRANIRYDAPFLLVPSIFKNVKYITREKIYCNILFANTMKPYFEVGYGIGTYLFNVGLFWGGQVNKPDAVGVKFTFEIFN